MAVLRPGRILCAGLWGPGIAMNARLTSWVRKIGSLKPPALVFLAAADEVVAARWCGNIFLALQIAVDHVVGNPDAPLFWKACRLPPTRLSRAPSAPELDSNWMSPVTRTRWIVAAPPCLIWMLPPTVESSVTLNLPGIFRLDVADDMHSTGIQHRVALDLQRALYPGRIERAGPAAGHAQVIDGDAHQHADARHFLGVSGAHVEYGEQSQRRDRRCTGGYIVAHGIVLQKQQVVHL